MCVDSSTNITTSPLPLLTPPVCTVGWFASTEVTALVSGKPAVTFEPMLTF